MIEGQIIDLCLDQASKTNECLRSYTSRFYDFIKCLYLYLSIQIAETLLAQKLTLEASTCSHEASNP